MSPSNRGSRWSNSGMVVEIQPEDIINDKRLTVNNEAEETFPELAVLHFQEELERQCWLQGGRRQTAPAQRMVDFTRKKLSYDLPESSYSPGLISSPLHFLDAGIHCRTTVTRLPTVRAQQPRFPDQRSRDDRGRNPYLFSGPHRTRQGYPATHHLTRSLPLWRRSRLCGRHRLGRNRWRTMRRSSSTIYESIDL